ncbi:hypothetical protein Plim_2191 [Planctopirus limnophila DSM 3776]|jgi:hypothetical protein|uniref:Uncharacterized protein n=2 Tax=Planctopirus TaxID=1649480 RepID=D5SMW2_PLAL2|nr:MULTISPECIES: hypothetical protein [Planctopirus]ADG68017.1 hypothetical protein Plim_2191 [Planctopirus limnophila DSM 3776]ODA27982.1 hypothetical protein A6X21_14015 [Planctopirus hydrillae]
MSSLAATKVDSGANVDLVEELRLRAWARSHYEPADRRSRRLHPIVLDEMQRKDQEQITPSHPR